MNRLRSPLPHLASVLLLALALLATTAPLAQAQSPYRGAGGPYLGGAWRQIDKASTAQLFIGGGGYVYLLDGRLRLGGGGQASLLSSHDNSLSGSLRWGGLDFGVDLLSSDRWELPITLTVGGGRYTLESSEPIPGRDHMSLVTRQAEGLGTVRLAAGIECRLTRAFKLALSLGYQIGFSSRVLLNGADLTLQTVFLIPR